MFGPSDLIIACISSTETNIEKPEEEVDAEPKDETDTQQEEGAEVEAETVKEETEEVVKYCLQTFFFFIFLLT